MSEPYIRPCAAFPDGYFLPPSAVPILTKMDLIVKDEWSENHTDDDYQAIYSEETLEKVAAQIERVVDGELSTWAAGLVVGPITVGWPEDIFEEKP